MNYNYLVIQAAVPQAMRSYVGDLDTILSADKMLYNRLSMI